MTVTSYHLSGINTLEEREENASTTSTSTQLKPRNHKPHTDLHTKMFTRITAFTLAAAAMFLAGQVQATTTIPRAALIAIDPGKGLDRYTTKSENVNPHCGHSFGLQPSQQWGPSPWVQLQVLLWPF